MKKLKKLLFLKNAFFCVGDKVTLKDLLDGKYDYEVKIHTEFKSGKDICEKDYRYVNEIIKEHNYFIDLIFAD